MELLGNALNNMDAASAEDEWTYPIFEKAQRMFPSRARDQRAEREDAQRPRPEAASPVVVATSGGEAPGRDEGWQPIETAPTDTPYTSDLPDEADGDAIGWAISDDDDRMLFLVWWEEQSPGRWAVTKWHPLPSAPRPSQREG